MPEIGGDKLVVRVWSVAYERGFIPIPVTQLRWAREPGIVVEFSRNPNGSLVRAVIQILPNCVGGHEKVGGSAGLEAQNHGHQAKETLLINILSMLLGQRESVLIIAHKRAYVTGSAWDTKNNALPGAGRQTSKRGNGKKQRTTDRHGEKRGPNLTPVSTESGGGARSLPKRFVEDALETLWLWAVGKRCG
jgi:hypothetical protein